MTTKSFKQALKAAKRDERHLTYAETKYWLNQYRMLAEQAIAAMEEAEKQEPVAWVNLDQYGNLHESSSQAVPPDTFPVYRHPPAAQQEPVAWRHEKFYEGASGWFYADWHSEGLNPPSAQLLYTTPPAAQWVGLTDDEIIDVIHPLVMADMPDEATDYEIARAIEAKLKEKNT